MDNKNLKSHNEKRKAQDSSDNNLKDSQDNKNLRDSQSSYEDFRNF